MRNSIIALVVFSAAGLSVPAAASGFTYSDYATGRIQTAETKIKGYNDKIATEKASIDKDRQRIANRKEIIELIKNAEAIKVTNAQTGDSACKAFEAAEAKMLAISKSGLNNPFDSSGRSLQQYIRSAKRKVSTAASGLTCKQLDFIVDDAPVTTAK